MSEWRLDAGSYQAQQQRFPRYRLGPVQSGSGPLGPAAGAQGPQALRQPDIETERESQRRGEGRVALLL